MGASRHLRNGSGMIKSEMEMCKWGVENFRVVASVDFPYGGLRIVSLTCTARLGMLSPSERTAITARIERRRRE